MQESDFKIYNASAGSGKTYTLAKSYLKKIIQSQNNDHFKSILAITFTNKAVGEMKERIIEMLKLFSNEKSKSQPHPMFIDICKELGISPEILISKSKHLLKHIIHNYGAFDVITIDGFTHRIIRTFAYDLKLPMNFEVELDQDRLLKESVDSLISKAGLDKALTKVLLEFAIEKADDDKSWDISYDFNKITKLLVNENHLFAIESLKDKNLEDFQKLKRQLHEDINTIENKIIELANNVITLIDECGLQFNDFSSSYLPKYFDNLKNKKYNPNYGASWQNILISGGTLYPKRVSDQIASTIDEIQPKLKDSFELSKRLVYDLKLKKGLYKNITPQSVLNAIKKELETIKSENNVLPISEFNKIISNEIKDQPTPFIYERLGEKYRHYYIDEFQDTSTLQWHNLIPLIDNALSSTNGSTMLVGDAKQAIYRWRGGDAEQFVNLYNKTTQPFPVVQNILNLSNNYRSAKAIVDFNNGFFKFLSQNYFHNEDYTKLYEQSVQETQTDIKGYVELSFLNFENDDDKVDIYCAEVLKTINKCLDSGHKLEDICVIVRNGKEGVAIAEYLYDHNIKITSSETLLLKNSREVRFVHDIITVLGQPNNQNLIIKVLSFIADQQSVLDKHLFFSTYFKDNVEDFFEGLEDINITISQPKLLHLPIYELVEEVIRTFQLNKTSNAFLQFYLDVVLEFTQREGSNIMAFLEYFDKKKDSLSVVSPEHLNAVKIMTIHKSKGLEFPVVIFPFADLNIYKEQEPKTWFPVDKTIHNGFSNLLLNFNEDVEHFGEVGAEIYKSRTSQLELDGINLLYVVLTRAVNNLFVISKVDINSKGEINNKTYSGMLISYLKEFGIWVDNQNTYTFGELELKQQERTEDKAETTPLISTPKESHNLSIVTKSGLLWNTKQKRAMERGNLVHLALSKIKTTMDVDFAFEELISQGDISTPQISDIRPLVENVINHPRLNSFFSGVSEVFNERDIITKDSVIIRPDRLNIKDNEVSIIDYKTGNHQTSHNNQINDYAFIINSMGYKIDKKLLVYINENVEIVEV
ncbi:MAG: UvrD-helicase domain-containing protein [Winogradskyella sp.]